MDKNKLVNLNSDEKIELIYKLNRRVKSLESYIKDINLKYILLKENKTNNISSNISNPSVNQTINTTDVYSKNNYFINNNYNYFANNQLNIKKSNTADKDKDTSTDLKDQKKNDKYDNNTSIEGEVKKNIIPISMKVLKNNLNEKRLILKNISKETMIHIKDIKDNKDNKDNREISVNKDNRDNRDTSVNNKESQSNNNDKSGNTSINIKDSSPIIISKKNKLTSIESKNCSIIIDNMPTQSSNINYHNNYNNHNDKKTKENIKDNLVIMKNRMKKVLENYSHKLQIRL